MRAKEYVASTTDTEWGRAESTSSYIKEKRELHELETGPSLLQNEWRDRTLPFLANACVSQFRHHLSVKTHVNNGIYTRILQQIWKTVWVGSTWCKEKGGEGGDWRECLSEEEKRFHGRGWFFQGEGHNKQTERDYKQMVSKEEIRRFKGTIRDLFGNWKCDWKKIRMDHEDGSSFAIIRKKLFVILFQY